MPYFFDNTNLLQYEHRPVRFSAGGRYKIEKNFSIQGTLRNFTNISGIYGILSGQEKLLVNANDWDALYLNDIFFGSGQIKNISFGGGTLVQSNQYTFDITCWETGNLFNVLSGYYSGINWDGNTKLLDEIEEDFSYSKDDELVENIEHNISIRYNKSIPPSNGINLAKLFAQNLFNSTQGIFPFLGQYQNLGNYKRLYTETYNQITATCGFNAAARLLPNQTGGYSYILGYQLQLAEDGFTTITETVDIQGLNNFRIQAAESGYSSLFPNSYNRAFSIYNSYGFSTRPIYTGAIQAGITKNNREGTISFTNTFSNNPRYTGLAIWEYETNINEDQQGFVTIDENGSIIGYGRPYIDKLGNAITFYNTYVSGSINNRLGVLYSGYKNPGKNLLTIGQSFERQESRGLINYSKTLTDNNLFINNSGIKKSEITISISNPTHIAIPFSVVNFKESIQPQNTVTQGSIDIDVRLKGQRGLDITGYLAFAKAIVRPYTGVATDPYVETVNYSISPLTNDFSLNANIKFHSGYKTFSDINVN